MMTATRSTHLVKCTNPHNPANVVVVEVLDAVTLVGPNHQEFVYKIPGNTGEKTPYIFDSTGDGPTSGDIRACSRASHMKRLVSNSDPNQCMDVEVLDDVSFIGPNHQEWCIEMPNSGISEFVTDNTNSGLGTAHTDRTTRAVHVAKISQLKPGARFGSDDTDFPPLYDKDETGKFMLIKRVDSVAFIGPNHQEWAMKIPIADANSIDTTVYDEDGDPPENPDPNPYIRWPKESKGPWLGDSVPVAQGPFWWIKRVEPLPAPWYYWTRRQQPLAFIFLWTKYILQDCHPVIWILSANAPLIPIDPVGFESLEQAIDNGTGSLWGALGGDIPQAITSDYGLLALDAPPNPAPWSAGTSGADNIWQLTGLPQPFEKDGKTPKYPKPQRAAEVAHKFEDNWNAVADATNKLIASWPDGYNPFADDSGISPPPAWPWAVQWHNPFFGGWWNAFDNGIPIGLGRVPLAVSDPATTRYIEVGQLDPAVWNTAVYPPARWAGGTARIGMPTLPSVAIFGFTGWKLV
jgi:hypothetical protein